MNDFISRAKVVHGDKYDYSKSIYTKYTKKLLIICPVHGDFWQTPKLHLKGSGCPECSIDKIKRKLSSSTTDFINKANLVHKNKYDYSKVEYKHSSEKVLIICPLHGEFKQVANTHLMGSGCPKCGTIALTKEEFILRAKKAHGDRYDYSRVEYINSHTKVKIICPVHGEFEQIPYNHLAGRGCCRCRNNYPIKTEEFISKAKKAHGDRYDYSKVEYINSHTKVKIVCPVHGEFEQIPFVHLNGYGCAKCSGKHRKNTNEFINSSKVAHGDKYDYSKVEYINSHTKVRIICPVHGEFEQIPSSHLRGCGCPKCYEFTLSDFISKANKIHKNRYDYSKSVYKNTYASTIIICPKHGEFEQSPSNHLQGHNCPYCSNSVSIEHQKIIEYIKGIYNNCIKVNDRNIIYPYELDIYLPKISIGIEYHGLFCHSFDHIESKKEKYKHYDKHELCASKNVNLLQIFENEWKYNNNIIKSKIKTMLGMGNKIHARKCSISYLTNKRYKDFIMFNHIQGYREASIKIGLLYQDEVVAVMSFSRHNKYEWEIIRYASLIDTIVVGGASKLFSEFVKSYKPATVMSYADRRYSLGNLYKKLGFTLDGITRPNYFYVKDHYLYKRQQFQKHKLNKKLTFFNSNMTEAQNMFLNGFRRLWDAGHYRFLYYNGVSF